MAGASGAGKRKARSHSLLTRENVNTREIFSRIVARPGRHAEIAVADIRPSANPIRIATDERFIEHLCKSGLGQLVPVVVHENRTGAQAYPGAYELIDGEHRWRAARKRGDKTIMAVVVEIENRRDQFAVSLAININRLTLTPLEIARAIDRLQQEGITQREIAKLLGKSQGWVNMRASLLALDPAVQELAGPTTPEDRRLSSHRGYLLVGLPPDTQLRLAKEVSGEQMSDGDARALVAEAVRREAPHLTQRNAGKLRLIENVVLLRHFIERTRNYVDGVLDYNAKAFEALFDGEPPANISAMAGNALSLSGAFTTLSETLTRIHALKLSANTEVVGAPPAQKESAPLGTMETWGTPRLLKWIGVTDNSLRCKVRVGRRASFWQRPVNHQELLKDAHALYKQQIAIAHPDAGGANEHAVKLNRVWNTLRKRFAQHGIHIE